MGTSGDHRNLMKTRLGVLLLLALVHTGTEAQTTLSAECPGPMFENIDENNAVDAVIITIQVVDSITLEITTPGVPFRLDGKDLVATEQLDFEVKSRYEIDVRCTLAGGTSVPFRITIFLNNLNDNFPAFEKEEYTLNMDEMSVKSLGPFDAVDLDDDDLIYTLTTSSDAFELKSEFEPVILVTKVLQYDDIKSVRMTLTVKDSPSATPDHTDSTTIDITIVDVDNRPPWFQHCEPVIIQDVKICPFTGYTGKVTLGKQETEPLPLNPNNLLAIDGDNGINEPINYSIVSGNEGGWFVIDAATGDITVAKAVDVTDTIHLTVMAFQTVHTYQFATTTITLEVVTTSAHQPQFEKLEYKATVEGVWIRAMDAADNTTPLKIIATDEDYAASGGINPATVYSFSMNDAFSINDGFLFMTAELAPGTYNVQVKAEDPETKEEATAQLVVEVVEEPTTTAPPTTVTTPTPEPTTGITTVPSPSPNPESTAITTNPTPTSKPDPTTNPDPTTKPDPSSPGTVPSTVETANPPSPGTTGPSVQTPNLTPTTEGITTHTGGVVPPGGDFTSGDMAALGATLGVLLFICIVVIAVLAVKIQKGKTDWGKINEASAFRSSLGPSGQKEGVQFTNEAFKHDDDDDDDKDNKGNGTVLSRMEADKPQSRPIPRPPSPIQEDEKEVKPILSKDKSKEDGYKAVWFKEDIDPNAKEEVVIIPDSRDDEEEDDSDGDIKMPKVKFNEADRDSGLGEKLEDSDDEKGMISSL